MLGVPFAVKDNTEIAGQTTEHGSASRAAVDSADSEVVRRLRAADLVVVGKTNLCELAIWPFTVSAAHGVTRNPWNPEVSCGGSSGGSAVAVAAGLVPAAHGTDGGGSIRIPAACCGLVGLKPTLGRVSPAPHRHGWQGLSTAGFITRTIGDNGVLLDLVGEELPGPSGSFAAAAEGDPPPLRVAVSAKPPVPAKVATEVRLALDDTAGVLATLGHEVVRADPPSGVVDVRFTPRYLRGIRDDFVRLAEPERAEPRTRAMAKMGARVPAAVLRRAGGAERGGHPVVGS
ncbi:MAG: amidase family protein [Frankiaceae bacterium]